MFFVIFREKLRIFYRRIFECILRLVEPEVLRCKIAISPYKISKILSLTIITLSPVSILASSALWILKFDITSILLPLLILPLVLVVCVFSLKIIAWNYTNSLEDEVLLFKIYSGMLAYEGLGLFEIFKKTLTTDIFDKLKREVEVVVRNVEVLGLSFRDAIEEAMKHTPSKRFKELVRNYVALEASGGDSTKFLEDEAVEALKVLEDKADRYSDSVSLYGELSVGVYLLISMMISLGLIFSPDVIREVLLTYLILILPPLTAVLLAIIDSNQLKLGLNYKPPTSIILVSTVAFTIPPVSLGFNVQSISIGLTLSTAIIGFHHLRYSRLCELEESHLPVILRSLIEYRKLGYTPYQSLERTLRERVYHGSVRRVIEEYVYKVKIGEQPSRISVESPSKLVRLIFRILGDAEEVGGGSPVLLERMHDLTVRVREVKRKIILTSRLYEVLAYLTPILLGFTSGLTLAFYDLTSTNILNVLSIFSRDRNLVEEMLKLQIVASSLSIGIVTSKIATSTIKSTYKTSIILGIATLIIQFLNEISKMISGMMV